MTQNPLKYDSWCAAFEGVQTITWAMKNPDPHQRFLVEVKGSPAFITAYGSFEPDQRPLIDLDSLEMEAVYDEALLNH